MVPIPVYIDIYRMNGGIIMRDNAMIVMFVKQEHQCKEGFDMDRTILRTTAIFVSILTGGIIDRD